MEVFNSSSLNNSTGDKSMRTLVTKGQVYEDLYLERDSSGIFDAETEGYYYFGDVTNLQKPWIKEPSFIPTVVVYSVAFLVGTVGNLIVICTILKDYKQRTNTTMFLVSLAVSDILFLAVCVPHETIRYFTAEWDLGNFYCKFSGFVEMMTALLTVLNLSVVSVERYVAIVHPLRSRYMCTIGNLRKLIPSVWILAAVLSSPTFCVVTTELSVFYNNESSVTLTLCADYGVETRIRLAFAVYQFLILFLLPTIVMLFCYIRVVYVLWVSAKHLSRMMPLDRIYDEVLISKAEFPVPTTNHATIPRMLKTALADHKSQVLASRKQVIKFLMAIILIFLLCWGPKLCMKILQKLQITVLYSKEAYVVKVVIDCLPYIQSCINPFVYCFMSGNFRKSLRIVFSRNQGIQRSLDQDRNTRSSHTDPTEPHKSAIVRFVFNTRQSTLSNSSNV